MYAARETLLYQPPEQINSLVSKDLLQQKLVGESEWIMDVDLGSYDAIEVRLRASDTIIFLDFSLVRCAWRAVRRPQERLDFWLWLLRYRRQNRPLLMKAISSWLNSIFPAINEAEPTEFATSNLSPGWRIFPNPIREELPVTTNILTSQSGSL